MPNIMQEKYEVRFKTKSQRENWTDETSALRPATDRRMSCLRRAVDDSDPGDSFVQSAMAGETDVSNNVNQNTLLNGYGRLPMSPVEDMYTAEHRDNFYDSITVDGDTGFCERNNYLDRE